MPLMCQQLVARMLNISLDDISFCIIEAAVKL